MQSVSVIEGKCGGPRDNNLMKV